LPSQTTFRRTSALYDDALAHRDTFGSLLVRFDLRSIGSLQYSALAGLSGALGSTVGYRNLKGGLAPIAGYYPLTFDAKRAGVTAGADIARRLTRRVSIAVPVRATWFIWGGPLGLGKTAYTPPQRPIPAWPGSVDLSVGVGFSYRLIHRVN
jgi:hypothetical protein